MVGGGGGVVLGDGSRELSGGGGGAVVLLLGSVGARLLLVNVKATPPIATIDTSAASPTNSWGSRIRRGRTGSTAATFGSCISCDGVARLSSVSYGSPEYTTGSSPESSACDQASSVRRSDGSSKSASAVGMSNVPVDAVNAPVGVPSASVGRTNRPVVGSSLVEVAHLPVDAPTSVALIAFSRS